MLLSILTVLIMLIVTYAFWQEGVLTAFTMLCNVLLAGLVAFNFWEPLAALLDPFLADNLTFLHGYEDSICLMLLFSLTLGLLRLTTNNLANRLVEYHPVLQQGGSVVCGLITGYLASGFLLCVLQTLPWHRSFMGFEAKVDPDASGAKGRRVLPADRVWLYLMHRAGLAPLAQASPTFDADGSFEDRYQRYRREGE
jgi:hypothetical protein